MVRLSVDEEVFARHGRYGVDYPEYEYFEREAPVVAEVRRRVVELLIGGTDVVIDHGLWRRSDREDWKKLVEAAGGRWRLLYFPVDRIELLRRLAARNRLDHANALMVTPEALDDFIARFDPPQGGGRGDHPCGFVLAWAPGRWPPGGHHLGRLVAPPLRNSPQRHGPKRQFGVVDRDVSVVPVEMNEEPSRLVQHGWGSASPHPTIEVIGAAPQVRCDLLAPFEVVDHDRGPVDRPVVRGPVVAAVDRYSRSCEHDLSGVGAQDPVGQEPAQRVGQVQARAW